MTSDPTRSALIEELVNFFLSQQFVVHGAQELEGWKSPPEIRNESFGSSSSKRPDVVAFDHETQRVIFGLARARRDELDAQEALEEYDFFLDHNAEGGQRASRVYVAMPADLVGEFTSLITHYIHRDYWHRIIPVAWGGKNVSGRPSADL